MQSPSLDRQALSLLVSDAGSAPSMHNAQPWKFRLLPDGRIQLRADMERTIPLADPEHRGLHLGCGAALFNLRVSAERAGWHPRVKLLPDEGTDPARLADVRLGSAPEAGGGGGDLDRLYPAIRRRHTSRLPFTAELVPEAVRDALRNAATEEGAQLIFPDAWHVEEVIALVDDAEYLERTDPDVREETAAWTRIGSEALTAPDGVPDYAFGPRKWDGRAPVRDFATGRRLPERDTATFEATPQLALLGTVHDTAQDWLRAGQALERVLLEATLRGLATAMTSQPLEWPELRWAVRHPRSETGHVHMVVRLGYGPDTPATPRRPVGEILDFG